MDPKKAAEMNDLRRGQAMLRSAMQDINAVIEAHVADDAARRIALMNIKTGCLWANNDLATRIASLGD